MIYIFVQILDVGDVWCECSTSSICHSTSFTLLKFGIDIYKWILFIYWLVKINH